MRKCKPEARQDSRSSPSGSQNASLQSIFTAQLWKASGLEPSRLSCPRPLYFPEVKQSGLDWTPDKAGQKLRLRTAASAHNASLYQDDLQPSTSGRDLDRYQSTSANTAGQRKKRSSELDQLLAASNTHQQFRAPLPKPALSSQAAKRSLQPEASLNITQAAAFAGAAAAVTAQQQWRDSYDDVSHLFRPDGTFKLPGGCRRSRSKRRRLATAEADQEAAAPAAAGPDMLARSALSTEEEEEGEVVMSQQQQQQQQQERAPSPAPEAEAEPSPAALTEAMKAAAAAAAAAEAPAEAPAAAVATVRHLTPDAEEEADRPMKTPRIGSCTDVHAASAALVETTAEAMTAAPEEPPATAQAVAQPEDAPVQDAAPEAAAETEAGAGAEAEANAEAEPEAGAEVDAEAEVHAQAEAKDCAEAEAGAEAEASAEAEADADADTAMAEAEVEAEAALASEAPARVAESGQQVVLALASTSGTSGDGDVSMVSQDSSSPDRVANTKVSPLTKPSLPASPSSPLQAADVFDKGQASD